MPVARTTEEGARQLIYAAIAGEKEGEVQVESLKGAFIQHVAVASPSPWVTSEEGGKVQEIFWNETLDTVGLFLRRFRKLWMSIFRSEIVVINRVLKEVIYVYTSIGMYCGPRTLTAYILLIWPLILN